MCACALVTHLPHASEAEPSDESESALRTAERVQRLEQELLLQRQQQQQAPRQPAPSAVSVAAAATVPDVAASAPVTAARGKRPPLPTAKVIASHIARYHPAATATRPRIQARVRACLALYHLATHGGVAASPTPPATSAAVAVSSSSAETGRHAPPLLMALVLACAGDWVATTGLAQKAAKKTGTEPASHLRVPVPFMPKQLHLARSPVVAVDFTHSAFSVDLHELSDDFLAGCSALRRVTFATPTSIFRVKPGFCRRCVNLTVLDVRGLAACAEVAREGFLQGCRQLPTAKARVTLPEIDCPVRGAVMETLAAAARDPAPGGKPPRSSGPVVRCAHPLAKPPGALCKRVVRGGHCQLHGDRSAVVAAAVAALAAGVDSGSDLTEDDASTDDGGSDAAADGDA